MKFLQLARHVSVDLPGNGNEQRTYGWEPPAAVMKKLISNQ